MGMLFIVELEREHPNSRLIVCRQCHTHLALFTDFKHLDINSSGQTGALFAKVVNLEIDCPRDHRASQGLTLADVRCVKCGERLGFKIIKDERPENPPEESEEGWAKLLLEKLDQWNGEEYWELDADTFSWMDFETGRFI